MYYFLDMVQDQFRFLFHQKFVHVPAFQYLYDLYNVWHLPRSKNQRLNLQKNESHLKRLHHQEHDTLL